MGVKKRGVFFTADAILALIIIFFVVILVVPLDNRLRYESSVHTDILESLSTLKVAEIVDKPEIQPYVLSGQITDVNKSVLEQIGEMYVIDEDEARTFAALILSSLDIEENIGIWFDDNLIFSINDTPIENATDIDVAKQIISGINNNTGSVSAYSSRAYLSSDTRTNYFYFGGYVGEGNISVRVYTNGTIDAAEMELAISDDFDLYINDVFEDSYTGSPSDFAPVSYTIVNTSLFNSGENIIEFRGDTLHITGGYLKITTQNDVQFGRDVKYYPPGISGLINIYDGFYVPSTLSYINISLHANSTQSPVFISIGNTIVYKNTTNDEETIVLDNATISSYINYADLVGKTTPIRIGLDNVTYEGIAQLIDAFSVVDLSGSMGGQKMADAKSATSLFIDLILNTTGNRVGLAGYETSALDSDFHELSTDESSLNDIVINVWDANGNTCICCGINKAIAAFQSEYLSITQNSNDDGEQIAYYQFEGNVEDSSGNNYDGALSGSGTSYPGGISGNSLSMNGNDRVEIPDMINSTEGTISMWVKLDVMDDQTLFDASTSDKYFFLDIDNQNDLRFQHEDATDADFQDAEVDVGSYPADQWYHVAAIWRFGGGTPSTELYFNGHLIDQDNDAAGDMPDFLTPYIGDSRSNYITTWDLDGEIDEVRVFSRALNITEIRGLNETSATCGNNVVEVGEVCDGSTKSCMSGVQACNASCSGYDSCAPIGGYCGDGFVNATEQCDDGNTDDDDGCNEMCELEDRFKSIVVMSDGEANRQCPEQPGTNAKNDAIQAAIDACDDYGIQTISIAFGSGADTDTMEDIGTMHSCNGAYYFSDTSNLSNVYNQIAQDIQTEYIGQTISVEGAYSRLFPDSYIALGYTQPATPGGLVFPLESQFTNNYTGQFSIPSGASIVKTEVTSYSGTRWTSRLIANDVNVYNISEYGTNFIDIGDPFKINVPNNLISDSTPNIINLTTSSGPANLSQPGSEYNKIIYTVAKNISEFSGLKAKAQGCQWTIQFENDENITTNVPNDYVGSNTCAYNPSTYDDQALALDDDEDAFQVAVYFLLREIDIDLNGKVDVTFSDQDLQIALDSVSGIPWSFSTEVQVRRWI